MADTVAARYYRTLPELRAFRKIVKSAGFQSRLAFSMQLLVSLCNLSQPDSSGLLLVDAESDTCIRKIDIGSADAGVLGCTGIWLGDREVYCAWAGADGLAHLSVLERPSLRVLETACLDGVRDVHSICVVGGCLYVASTGTDEIRRVPATSPGSPSAAVWRASASALDSHHLNSLLPVEGTLLCTAFGPKASERWSSALHGYVMDVGSNRLLVADIEHPHSLTRLADDLYVAESRRCRVRSLGCERSIMVDGYARGLCAYGDEFLIGISRGRARSRSMGTIENAADPGEPGGQTGVLLTGERGTTIERFHDLSSYGPEVYDVVVLASDEL